MVSPNIANMRLYVMIGGDCASKWLSKAFQYRLRASKYQRSLSSRAKLICPTARETSSPRFSMKLAAATKLSSNGAAPSSPLTL
ncbi:hypothetical protein D3C80_1488800 [compost metagenome]